MSSIPDDRAPEFDGVPRLLARSVQLLRCFTFEDDTLSAQELVARSGLARSTVYRLTSDLVRVGLLMSTTSGRFAIGALVWELGQFTYIHVRLRQAAHAHLTRLYEACGENVFIAVMTTTVPESAETMFVGHVRGPRSTAVLGHEGGRFPLHATASGRALVAAQTPEWIARFLGRPFHRQSHATTWDPSRMAEVIRTARARGYAVQMDEMTPGAAGISVPIPYDGDLPTTVVTIAGSSAHWDERHYASMLKVTAQAIARDIDTEAV